MGIRIIVDSTADLTPQVRQRVAVVPLTIHFGEEEYVDGVNITGPEFYEKLVTSKVLPSTSQATPFAFSAAFGQAVADGDEVVAIIASSKLSGTYQSAVIAAQDYPGKVHVVDSLNIALGSAVLTEYALRLVDEGRSAQEIAFLLEAAREAVVNRNHRQKQRQVPAKCGYLLNFHRIGKYFCKNIEIRLDN